MDWFSVKIAFLEWSGLPRDLLHVYAGVSLQLVSALLMRRTVASVLPLVPVVTLEAINEWYDLQSFSHRAALPEQFWNAVAWDFFNTLSLPVLLFLVARFLPSLLVAAPKMPTQAD